MLDLSVDISKYYSQGSLIPRHAHVEKIGEPWDEAILRAYVVRQA